MIYSKITPGARLGNVLFQVAAGASLAKSNGDCFSCIALGEKYKYVRQFSKNILRNIDIISCVPDNVVEYREPSFSFTPIEYQDNLCLEGYFQSEKYFDRDYVRELFAISDRDKDRLMQQFPVIASDNVCSISVRRGDYFKYPAHHPVCSKRFYFEAMKLLPEETVFLICSDDLEWCKKIFKGERFVFADNTSAVDQLYLQSLCRDNITSNTSFGWWGAWLNPNPQKKVIYPERWFGLLYRELNIDDLIPQGWIGIDCRPVLRSRIGAIRVIVVNKLVRIGKKIKKALNI